MGKWKAVSKQSKQANPALASDLRLSVMDKSHCRFYGKRRMSGFRHVRGAVRWVGVPQPRFRRGDLLLRVTEALPHAGRVGWERMLFLAMEAAA